MSYVSALAPSFPTFSMLVKPGPRVMVFCRHNASNLARSAGWCSVWRVTPDSKLHICHPKVHTNEDIFREPMSRINCQVQSPAIGNDHLATHYYGGSHPCAIMNTHRGLVLHVLWEVFTPQKLRASFDIHEYSD